MKVKGKIPCPECGHRFSPVEQMLLDYCADIPVKTICKTYSVSRHTLSHHARKAGLPVREQSYPVDLINKVARDYESKVPAKRIAKKYKVSLTFIAKVAVARGINRRSVEARQNIARGIKRRRARK